MRYNNRIDAAMELIPFLEKYRNEVGVVLAVPRGGVPLGHYIAKKFHFPLELLMTKKIGHPHNSELAIGAVSLEDYIIDERINVSRSYIESSIHSIRKDLIERYAYFMGTHKSVDLTNKVLIIIDDGIATGNTILSAIDMLRRRKPKKIVVAVPVAPPESIAKMRKFVDDFICPYTPENFVGVGYHYMDFSEVTDEEVIRLIKEVNEQSAVA